MTSTPKTGDRVRITDSGTWDCLTPGKAYEVGETSRGQAASIRCDIEEHEPLRLAWAAQGGTAWEVDTRPLDSEGFPIDVGDRVWLTEDTTWTSYGRQLPISDVVADLPTVREVVATDGPRLSGDILVKNASGTGHIRVEPETVQIVDCDDDVPAVQDGYGNELQRGDRVLHFMSGEEWTILELPPRRDSVLPGTVLVLDEEKQEGLALPRELKLIPEEPLVRDAGGFPLSVGDRVQISPDARWVLDHWVAEPVSGYLEPPGPWRAEVVSLTGLMGGEGDTLGGFDDEPGFSSGNIRVLVEDNEEYDTIPNALAVRPGDVRIIDDTEDLLEDALRGLADESEPDVTVEVHTLTLPTDVDMDHIHRIASDVAQEAYVESIHGQITALLDREDHR